MYRKRKEFPETILARMVIEDAGGHELSVPRQVRFVRQLDGSTKGVLITNLIVEGTADTLVTTFLDHEHAPTRMPWCKPLRYRAGSLVSLDITLTVSKIDEVTCVEVESDPSSLAVPAPASPS